MTDGVTYEHVAPLVGGIDRFDGGVEVVFRCRRTGVEVRAEGRPGRQGALATGAGLVGGKLMGSVREGVGRSVRRAIQTGMLPGGVGAAAYKATGALHRQPGDRAPGDAQEQAAVLDAFASVAHRFRWDDADGAFVAVTAPVEAAPAPGAPSPAPVAGAAVDLPSFAAQLEAHPLASERDLSVLARLLAAVVAGDGEVGAHERATFAYLAPGADLDSLVRQGPPGPFELAATSPGGARETILLLAWAVAVTDEALGAAERGVLDEAAAGLGLDDATAARVRRTAQRHVLDESAAALRAAGWDEAAGAAELSRVAAAIGWE